MFFLHLFMKFNFKQHWLNRKDLFTNITIIVMQYTIWKKKLQQLYWANSEGAVILWLLSISGITLWTTAMRIFSELRTTFSNSNLSLLVICNCNLLDNELHPEMRQNSNQMSFRIETILYTYSSNVVKIAVWFCMPNVTVFSLSSKIGTLKRLWARVLKLGSDRSWLTEAPNDSVA